MEPGRELDLLIAKKVLGKTVVCIRALRGYQWNGDPVFDEVPCIEEHGVYAYLTYMPDAEYVLHLVPFYSYDIEAAWEVVEKLRSDGYDVEVTAYPGLEYGCRVAPRGEFNTPNVVFKTAETASLAICYAALAAVQKGVMSGCLHQ